VDDVAVAVVVMTVVLVAGGPAVVVAAVVVVCGGATVVLVIVVGDGGFAQLLVTLRKSKHRIEKIFPRYPRSDEIDLHQVEMSMTRGNSPYFGAVPELLGGGRLY